MFNEINEGGLNQVLSRRLGMQGGAPASACAPEVFPTLTLENDRPEWGYLKGERLCSTQLFRAAVAGQFSSVQMYLPANSNTIAVVTKLQVLNANQSLVSRLTGISGGIGPWTAQGTATRDFRWAANRTSVIVETIANVAQPANTALALFNFNAQELADPIVIVPGTALAVIGNVVNQAVSVNVAWYERPVLPGELG